MNVKVLLLIAAILALMFLIWVIYRITERLISLEAKPDRIYQVIGYPKPQTPASQPPSVANDLFFGLTGESLFNALADEDGGVHTFEEDARKRYELILRKHILFILDQVREGQSNIQSEAMIGTLRGEVLSWLPTDIIDLIVRDARALVSNPTNSISISNINETISKLYERLSLSPPGDFLSVGDEPNSLESEQQFRSEQEVTIDEEFQSEQELESEEKDREAISV